MKRVFVAVPIAVDARHRIAHLLSERLATIPGRVVSPENWHVTLRFLGEVGESTYDRLLACLESAELGDPFTVRWAGLGSFPNPRRATVLWVGLDRGEELLAGLADAVDDAVDGAGLPPEDRPFNPHMTLSRIRPPQDVGPLVEEIEPLTVTMEVDRVVVYQSRLGDGGGRYQALETFPLG